MKEFLAEACQNTFVLFDALKETSLSEKSLQIALNRLREEDRDDALILYNGQEKGDSFSSQMLVLGQDGNVGEYCGNGARACAAYLFDQYSSYRTLFLRTGLWMHRLTKLGKDQFSVTLPPVSFKLNPKFVGSNNKLDLFQYVEAIEPHLTIEKEMSDEELTSLGRELNADKKMFPLGININAWYCLDDSSIAVKTYERGVQRLTKSCGTGSISCASVFVKRHPNVSAVRVVTPGGSLKILIRDHEVELCGEGKYE